MAVKPKKEKSVKKPVVITPKDGREPCAKGYVRNSHGDCVPDV